MCAAQSELCPAVRTCLVSVRRPFVLRATACVSVMETVAMFRYSTTSSSTWRASPITPSARTQTSSSPSTTPATTNRSGHYTHSQHSIHTQDTHTTSSWTRERTCWSGTWGRTTGGPHMWTPFPSMMHVTISRLLEGGAAGHTHTHVNIQAGALCTHYFREGMNYTRVGGG